MAAVVMKKPPPARPLGRSSLSGNQPTRTDGMLLFERKEAFDLDKVRPNHISDQDGLEVSDQM